jgi:hypothetical protein
MTPEGHLGGELSPIQTKLVARAARNVLLLEIDQARALAGERAEQRRALHRLDNGWDAARCSHCVVTANDTGQDLRSSAGWTPPAAGNVGTVESVPEGGRWWSGMIWAAVDQRGDHERVAGLRQIRRTARRGATQRPKTARGRQWSIAIDRFRRPWLVRPWRPLAQIPYYVLERADGGVSGRAVTSLR